MLTNWLLRMLPVLLACGVAVPATAADDPPTRKELLISVNNLKQIGICFHAYHDANNAFPGNIMSKDGKPLLSWRVAILPYLEQDQLYKQFKLDEPWDSDNNKKLIAKMPKQFAPVRGKVKAGETFYQIFVGKEVVFSEKGPQYKINTIPDGTSNTALVVEAGDPVVWTKPVDLPFDSKKDLPKLGGLFGGEFHVLRVDGSVMMVRKDFDAAEMKNFIMPADGNPLDLKKLQKK